MWEDGTNVIWGNLGGKQGKRWEEMKKEGKKKERRGTVDSELNSGILIDGFHKKIEYRKNLLLKHY